MTKPAACLLLLVFLLFATMPIFEAQQTTLPTVPDNGFKIQGTKSKPSVTLILIVLVCVFCLVGLSAFAVRHCSVNHSDPIPINPRISADGGLDPDLIETFPIIMYSEVKDLKIGNVPLQCAVCLNEFQDDESLRILPRCDHVFHPECIDIWLATNITCPVCRTDLATEDDEIDGDSLHAPPIIEPSAKSELGEEKKQVSINVPEDPAVEIVQINQQSKQNRPPRSKSTRTGMIPRSHSTGHSLVQPGENLDRFTLRLPEEVKNQIAINSRLNRARSNGAGLPRVRSERTGFRSGSSGNGIGYLSRGSGRFDRMAKSDRGWVFTLAPPFLSRGNSVRSPNNLTAGGANEKTYLTSPLRMQFNSGTKSDVVEKPSTRPQV